MRQSEHIATRDRYRTCWEMIGWFSNPLYVKAELQRRYGDEQTSEDKRFQEIASFVRQAIEYFQAATSATLATRPTLLYYSLVQFAGAIWIASDPIRTQAKRKGGHGLKVPKSTGDSKEIELSKLQVSTQSEGTWHELLQALKGDYYGMPDIPGDVLESV